MTLDLPSAGPITPGQRTQTTAVTLAWLLALVGTVVSQLIWNRHTRRLAERYGLDSALVIHHWFLRLYTATAFVTVILQPLLTLDKRESIALITAIRLAAGLALLANVLIGRTRLLRLIADSARQSQQTPHPAQPRTPNPTDTDTDERWNRLNT